MHMPYGITNVCVYACVGIDFFVMILRQERLQLFSLYIFIYKCIFYSPIISSQVVLDKKPETTC